jgi:hypothetical protein
VEKTHDLEIGHVIEVNGTQAVVELTVDPGAPLAGEYYPGQPGSHVKIPFRNHNVIGTVTRVRLVDGAPTAGSAEESTRGQVQKKIADCLLIGQLTSKGRFDRGVAIYPNVGQKVKMVSSAEMERIFSEFVGYDFSFGSPAQAEDQRVYVHADRFFSRHVAVVGATGCGKSCTVASILQRVIKKYPYAHIIVLDLHGEYAAAFPDHAFLIEADKVEIPYWLLNFEEFEDLAVDPNEIQAQNQITVLRDGLLRARQITDRKKSLGLGAAVTVDSPIYFELEDMLGLIRGYNIQMLPDASGKLEKGPLFGAFDRFMIRFESKVADPRFRFMFKPTTYTDSASLPILLKEYLSIDTGKRMAVIDLSGIPNEAIRVVVALVSRMVFEFNLWNPERNRFPILMVYEEAHNYIPSRAAGGKPSPASEAVERIAKEGRKQGVGAIIVSQRPKELSETVLAQCNTAIVMRMSNPDDQDYVKRLVPSSLSGLLEMIPSLPTGQALIVGDSISMPTRICIDCPDPMPESSDVEFAKWWERGARDIDVERVVARWRTRRKDL